MTTPLGQTIRTTGAAAFAATLLATSTLYADIPPPPPEIPFVGIHVPTDGAMFVGGLFLSLAVAAAGWIFTRGYSVKTRAVVLIVSLMLLVGSLFAFAKWAGNQRAAYQRRLDNWVSPSLHLQQRRDAERLAAEQSRQVESSESSEVESGDVESGEVAGGEVEGGDVESGDVESGEVESGEVEGGEVEGGEVAGGDVGEPAEPCL